MAIRANRLRGVFLRRGWREEDANELVELDAEARAEERQAVIDELEARLQHERELAAAERARLDDKLESSYERLLAELRNVHDRLGQLEQKIEQEGKLSDERMRRRFAQQGLGLAGLILGVAGLMAGLAAAGVFG